MLTKGCGVFEAAAAEGLPAIAATTIKTMIADPRFPDVFLAMSPSLSPQISTYMETVLSRPLCVGRMRVASPFRGRERRDSLDRGISDARSMYSNWGDACRDARK